MNFQTSYMLGQKHEVCDGILGDHFRVVCGTGAGVDVKKRTGEKQDGSLQSGSRCNNRRGRDRNYIRNKRWRINIICDFYKSNKMHSGDIHIIQS